MVFDAIRLGDIQCLEALANRGADFNCYHPEHGYTTLQAVINDHILPQEQKVDLKRAAQLAKQLAEWLVHHGADPNLEARAGRDPMRWDWYLPSVPEAKLVFATDDHSAFSLVVKLRSDALMLKNADEWAKAPNFSCLGDLMHMFMCTTSTWDPSSTQQVQSSVLDLWDTIRADTGTHDLTIQCPDASVSAHSFVICAASPVVKAMLSSGMVEAAKKEICVDCSSNGVSFLLDLIYTGTSCQDFSTDFGLAALDLAHRWQLSDVVGMLVRALIGALNTDNFADVAEAAVCKDLEQLKAACRRMAAVKKEVREKPLPDVVLAWLDGKKPFQRRMRKKQRVAY